MPASSLDAGLAGLKRAVIQGARQGLDQEAEALGSRAAQGGGFQNVTEAERGSTVAYVPGTSDDVLSEAAALVEGRNPGFSQVESAGSYDPDTEVLVVLTAPTTYAVDLETRNGGADAALGPALLAGADGLTRAAADGIRGALR